MEFWGIEVKAGQKFKVHIGSDKILHLSQASLGVSKKGKGKENESVPLFLNFDDQKLVIGTLSPNKCNQMTFDLVFEKEFELSHNWANGSVFFCGYKSDYQEEEDESDTDDDSSEEDEDIPLVAQENGIPEQKDVPSKPDNAKSKVKVVEPIKEMKTMELDTDSDDDEEDDSEDDSDDEEDESAEKPAVKKMADNLDEEDEDNESSDEEDDDSSEDEDNESSDDEDEDESSDEEDEATPKKAEQNKKRPAPLASGSDIKTPTGKKAKLVTPQKIGGVGGEGKKTGGHIATPYPSKQAGKISANKDKSKQQTPASDGQVSCGSCTKSFKSDQARDSHSKAKHSAAK